MNPITFMAAPVPINPRATREEDELVFSEVGTNTIEPMSVIMLLMSHSHIHIF